jgi:hypothetical protein
MLVRRRLSGARLAAACLDRRLGREASAAASQPFTQPLIRIGIPDDATYLPAALRQSNLRRRPAEALAGRAVVPDRVVIVGR